MRLRALLFVLTALIGVGATALRLGETATDYVERSTRVQVAEGLQAAGEDWATAQVDGLIVTLRGVAPDEGRRLRAAEVARRIVEPREVRDATTVAAPQPLAPTPFALEMLRNETEVSLIGLAPETAGRAAIVQALAEGGLDGAVSDMLESVAKPPPHGWEAALDFGLAALGDLPRAKISVTPGRVAIMASAETEAARAALEDALRAARPQGVILDLDLSAPRPMIAPFAAEFVLANGVARLAACTAETPDDAATIAAAAGFGSSACTLGLGAPSPGWAAAVAAGVRAVRALGGGRFAIADMEAALTGPDGVAPERLAEIGAALAAELPEIFSLAVTEPAPAAAADAGGDPVAAPRFDAILLEDGTVRLTGPVHDATSRDAIFSYAAALFGHDRVTDATVIDPGLPDGWPGRVLIGVEALALMKEGRLEVTPEGVAVQGWAAEADGAAKARALFAAKDVAPASVAVRFDAAAAAVEAEARAVAADPVGACWASAAAILKAAPIAFRPGSATLEPESATVIGAVAEALADCPALDLEIAGHTDSQGSADRNLELSDARAAAVKAALDAAGLPHVRFVARGYGAERPVADNDTETGRALNRRIEFTLLRDDAPAATAPGIAEAGRGPQ